MIVYKTWCEWDFGWNFNEYSGVYKSLEDVHTHLESIIWQDVGYDTWQDVEEDGLLTIEAIEI